MGIIYLAKSEPKNCEKAPFEEAPFYWNCDKCRGSRVFFNVGRVIVQRSLIYNESQCILCCYQWLETKDANKTTAYCMHATRVFVWHSISYVTLWITHLFSLKHGPIKFHESIIMFQQIQGLTPSDPVGPVIYPTFDSCVCFSADFCCGFYHGKSL